MILIRSITYFVEFWANNLSLPQKRNLPTLFFSWSDRGHLISTARGNAAAPLALPGLLRISNSMTFGADAATPGLRTYFRRKRDYDDIFASRHSVGAIGGGGDARQISVVGLPPVLH